MPVMNRLRPFVALLGAATLLACEENAVQDITGPMPSASVKFHNFGLGAPGVNFYADDVKLTAFFSSPGEEATSGTAYGAVAAGGYYTAIEPGQRTLNGRIAATTDKDLVVSSVPTTIEAGKAYSYFQSGVYNTTAKTVDAFVVEDPVPAAIDYAVAHVRFVNASANASPMTLFATPDGGAAVDLGGPVAYKAAGAFTTITPGVYDLAARVAGATTGGVARADVSFEGGRVYTITLRGDVTITSTTAANRPQLDYTANR
jgi:hypothetical protein